MRPAKASPFGRGVCAADGEGKPGTKEHLHSDKHWLLIESSYRCVFVLSQRPCPLRRSAPAPPKGELACRSGFPSYNLSVSLRSTAPLVGEPLAKPFTLRGLPKPLPLGEVALRSNDGEGKPGTKEHPHSDKHWLLIESSYRCVFVLSQRPCPLRRSAPAPPKGEPLACRSGFHWTSKVRCLGNGSAPLSRPAAA